MTADPAMTRAKRDIAQTQTARSRRLGPADPLGARDRLQLWVISRATDRIRRPMRPPGKFGIAITATIATIVAGCFLEWKRAARPRRRR